MYKAIKSIFEKWGCHHQWRLEFEREVVSKSDFGGVDEVWTSRTYICTKCGKFKRWRSS